MDSDGGQSVRLQSAERIIAARGNAYFQRALYLEEDRFLHAVISHGVISALPPDAIWFHSKTTIQQCQNPNSCDGAEMQPTGEHGLCVYDTLSGLHLIKT